MLVRFNAIEGNGQKWFIGGDGLHKNLFYYQDKIKAKHAFQVEFDMEYVPKDCFRQNAPVIVPAQTFLSQLV